MCYKNVRCTVRINGIKSELEEKKLYDFEVVRENNANN